MFDFGKASEQYAKYRDIYTDEIFDRLYEIGVGREGSRWSRWRLIFRLPETFSVRHKVFFT